MPAEATFFYKEFLIVLGVAGLGSVGKLGSLGASALPSCVPYAKHPQAPHHRQCLLT